MSAVLPFVLYGALVFYAATLVVCAQDSGTKPNVTLDFSDDPCGNPLVESQLWASTKGIVTGVIDGRTLLVTLPHRQSPLRVLLGGVSPKAKDKEVLARLLLGKPVEILVNSDWKSADRKPTETTGVVHLEKSTTGVDDVGLFLLSRGLARFQEPPPNSMSRYTECQYRRAEGDAQAKKLGIWAQPR